MGRTHEALRSVGIDARPLDWWAREEPFEILHVWGLEPQHQSLVRIARDYGKKVALTPLLPYVTVRSQIRHWAAMVLGRKRPVTEILRNVDVLLVVNRLQADSAMKIFGFPARSIEVIPTILDPLFFDSSAAPAPLDGLTNYFVCAGNVWPRKNQVRMAQAALLAGCSMIFIGNEMGGEKAYAEEFQRIVDCNSTLKWYKWLSWEDLYRVMHNASGVVLPSLQECQPASCLEAVALQKPLLMANEPYAFQEFYTGAKTVNPRSVESIAEGLSQIMAKPTDYTPRRELVEDCRFEAVALKLSGIFERLLA
jgi:glycosyltransferase involved in cell wall biosynthesis